MKQTIYLLLLLVLASCGGRNNKVTTTASEIEINYARHFRMEQRTGYVVVHILQPETGKTERSFALVKKEQNPRLPSGLIRIDVPVKNMAVLSTTHIGMLSVLNELKCVKGTTGEAFISNERIKKGIHTGKITAFNDEASITPERLLSKHISVVMYSGFGKEFPNDAKLQKLGIFPMANYDWREEHPLGKAEWVKLFGYLTGKEEKAMIYFEQLKATYFTLTKELKTIKKQPEIVVGSLIGDIWYAPAGESYMAHLLKDAGTNYIYSKEKGTGSCEKSLEQVFKDQREVKLWINAGAVSLNELKQQQGRYALFDAFQSGKIYCYTHNSSYFWEMAAIHPDWLLSDFAIIAGNKKNNKLYFYQQLK